MLCLSSVHSFKILQQHLLWGCSASTKSVQSSASGFSFALCFRDGLFARSSFSAIPSLNSIMALSVTENVLAWGWGGGPGESLPQSQEHATSLVLECGLISSAPSLSRKGANYKLGVVCIPTPLRTGLWQKEQHM